MEFKLIIYIIGAIVWAVYNYNQNKEKYFKNRPQLPIPSLNKPEPFETKKNSNEDATQVLKKVATNNRIGKTANIKAQKPTINQDFVPTYYKEGPKSEKEFSTKNEFSRLDEFDQDPTSESLGSLIGNELRSGEIDFRRAIILTEIIRPAYINK